MRPFVQSIIASSPADDEDPEDPHHFRRHLMIFIGVEGEPWTERFDLTVCSPSWFAAQAFEAGWPELHDDTIASDRVVTGRGVWFMQTWDRTELATAIDSVVSRGRGAATWTTAALRINEEIPWEFDYRHRG